MRGFAPSMRAVAIISAPTSATANAIGRLSFVAASIPAAIAFSASIRPRLSISRMLLPVLQAPRNLKPGGKISPQVTDQNRLLGLGRFLQGDRKAGDRLFPFIAQRAVHPREIPKTAAGRLLLEICLAVPEAADVGLLPACPLLGLHGEEIETAGIEPVEYARKGGREIAQIDHRVRAHDQVVGQTVCRKHGLEIA